MTQSNAFPLMIQVASKTIGLYLVSVNPLPGPKMTLGYLDFTYGDPLTERRIKKIKSIYNKL
jgi:hypothetical protein